MGDKKIKVRTNNIPTVNSTIGFLKLIGFLQKRQRPLRVKNESKGTRSKIASVFLQLSQ